MTDRVCTEDEAVEAVEYHRQCWGGFPIPDPERRAFVRLFRTCTVTEVRTAIDDLVRVADRRPAPGDLGQRVRLIRRRARLEAITEPYGDAVPAHASPSFAEAKSRTHRVPQEA